LNTTWIGKTKTQSDRWAMGAVLALFALGSGPAMAQSSCSSDGEPTPRGLLERFVNADCDTCWRDPATPAAKPGETAVDWVLPGHQGEDAPLSAVALRDAMLRLEALKQTSPPTVWSRQSVPAVRTARRSSVEPTFEPLRVARGVALNGYMGASIELRFSRSPSWPPDRLRYPLTAWLVLAEDIPAGSEGSPVPRALIRNSLVSTWKPPRPAKTPATTQAANPTAAEAQGDPVRRHFESRPMSLPPGSNPDRINVVGWVEDANGRLVASAVSRCRP
jgi:hypothetical protein